MRAREWFAAHESFEAEWRDAWKRYFHVTRIGRRTVVVPSWEHHDDAPGEVVMLTGQGDEQLAVEIMKAETAFCMRSGSATSPSSVSRAVMVKAESVPIATPKTRRPYGIPSTWGRVFVPTAPAV